LFGQSEFDFPKSIHAVEKCVEAATDEKNALVLDYFGGSGTTAHAVINLNRKDKEDGKRKYILAEMGEYFDTVLKPRIQKVIYSDTWQNGKPVSRKGSSHIFKYIRLESYEDTLNNLELQRAPNQQAAFDLPAAANLREDYLLHYALDVEAQGSLLSLDNFDDPFNVTLKVSTGTVGQTQTQPVDLVETFNYLLGLRVKAVLTFPLFVTVEGINPAGEKTLVLWRAKGVDNAALDDFFRKQGYTTQDHEFALIYVNGDSNLENLRRDDQTWKVRLIDEEFTRLMFEGAEG
jgi:adenine-specific DNA-methyltransferase